MSIILLPLQLNQFGETSELVEWQILKPKPARERERESIRRDTPKCKIVCALVRDSLSEK